MNNITTDTSFLMMLFILPSLFGLTLIGEGVGKIMNYDNRGWIGISVGSVFVIIIILAYFMMSSRTM
jgi:hypothetical protein